MDFYYLIQTQKYRHESSTLNYVFIKNHLHWFCFSMSNFERQGFASCISHGWTFLKHFSTWFFATDWDIVGLVLHSASSTLAASTEGKFLTLKNAYNYYCTSTILLSPPAYDGKHSWAGPKVLWFGTLPPFKSLRMNAGLKSLN